MKFEKVIVVESGERKVVMGAGCRGAIEALL